MAQVWGQAAGNPEATASILHWVEWFAKRAQEAAATVRQLCERAGVPCKASGAWCERGVSWEVGEELSIQATPGYTGRVHVVLPADKARSPRATARSLLLVLAHGLHNGVAKESVRGVDWARRIVPKGRPPVLRAKTGAQRQRERRAGARPGPIA